MKKTILCLLFLVLSVSTFAQKKMIYLIVQKIDQSTLLYYYKYTHNENGIPEQVPMLLQVGSKVQRFGCMSYFQKDSLAFSFENEPQDTRILSKESGKIKRREDCQRETQWTLFLNYPEKKRTITDRVFTYGYLTEEHNDQPKWRLAHEKKTLFGYKCTKATTTLYGRAWTAWYAPEISRTDGPWLLRGLPGVVVMAEDETGKFRFELQRIEHRETPILYQVKDYTKADRNSVLKQKQKYFKNRGQFIMGTAVGAQTSGLSSSEEVPYDPIRKIQE